MRPWYLSSADALQLWAKLCRTSVHVRLLSADALKLWARLCRRYVLVSQATDHPRSSLSLGKVGPLVLN